MRSEGPRPDPLAVPIEALHAEGRLRVWSLVVTVFGDAVAPRGGRIATARLGAVTGRVGVGEGALRTALSRLVADGTLERDREGRASFHRLGEAAAREVEAASRVIYAPPAGRDGWTIGSGPPPGRALPLPGGGWLTRDPPPEGAVAVRGRLLGVPPVEPAPPHAAALDAMAADLDALEETAPALAPLDALAARLLLVHRWRRIALRWPDLPPSGGADRRDAPRARVAGAYRALLPASERWLGGPGVPAEVSRRFS